jgi:hypothetical protein
MKSAVARRRIPRPVIALIEVQELIAVQLVHRMHKDILQDYLHGDEAQKKRNGSFLHVWNLFFLALNRHLCLRPHLYRNLFDLEVCGLDSVHFFSRKSHGLDESISLNDKAIKA